MAPSDCPRCEYDETCDPNCPWCALESSTPPAQPASTLDTNPPSRTSNAASANDAASLLLKLRERLQEVPTEAYGSMGMPDAVRDFRDSVIDHIDDLLNEHGTAKARSVEPSCNTCKDTGFVTLRCPCSLPKDPLPEPAIRAAVYGCTDAQCVCGRCGTIKIAVDCSIERVLR